ncbi:MAG: hypothetical protein AB1390_08510 [Nitrospirota bacterium]
MRRFIFVVLYVLVLMCLSNYSLALPPGPPPPDKVWIEVGGEWILVVAPPGEGPYVWKDSKWIIDPTPPPPNSEWIPGHWTAKGWIPGHWAVVPSPGPGVHWVPGHWKHGKWIQGHWAGRPKSGKQWVPGHRGPGGRWIPGHWK